jgi:hypothetical protein
VQPQLRFLDNGRYLIKIENKKQKEQIKNLDFIYLINLDKRPERLIRSNEQLARFNLQAHRFPAIYGWELSQAVFNDIALQFHFPMFFDRPVHFALAHRRTKPRFLNASCYGRACVHYTMAAGALGCYLSHLSILLDAFKSGYQTIWVLEDDCTIQENPAVFSEWLDQLDSATDKDWDVLYTDNDDHFISETVRNHMGGGAWGRPGIPMTSDLWRFQTVGKDFYRIGGRTQTHSMIYRRRGISKILDFIMMNGIFRPYDLDLPFIPDLKLFNAGHDIVHGRDRAFSDTFYQIK